MPEDQIKCVLYTQLEGALTVAEGVAVTAPQTVCCALDGDA